MFLNRMKSAAIAALVGAASISSAFALQMDPQRIIPERSYQEQMMHYYRATINFSDPRIASGVWYATLPKGAYVYGIDAYVTTAFNAGTTNVVTLGATAANANEIVAAGAITPGTVGVYHLTTAAGLGLAVTNNATYQTAINGAVPVYAKFTQTGTAATSGSLTVVIAYMPNNDQ